MATDTDIIQEYITDGVSAIRVKNNQEALLTAVYAVDANAESYRSYADAACERFVNFFSGEAIGQRLDEMIDRNLL